VKIGICAVHEVDIIWPEIRDGIQHACEKVPGCGWNAGLYWQMCRSGNGFLVLVFDGVEIKSASVWRFEAMTFRCLVLFGNDYKSWAEDMHRWANQVALEQGAACLIAGGRKGWLRRLRPETKDDDFFIKVQKNA
jgi:hypothetical protein